MTKTRIEKGKLGSSFEDFLEEQGTLAETTERSVKRVIAWQLGQIMAEKKITKVEMARRMAVSRSQLDRLLDPDDDAMTLATLSKAAKAVGRKLKLELS
jgi:DNA-binding Xre family transcriptional regulator